MKRKASCVNQDAMNRGPWSPEEDRILINYVQVHGEGKWRELSKRAGLNRRGKSCRLRWLNYLKPDVKRGNISSDEEDLIIRLHSLLGNRWSLIAGRLPGRTDNEIKNYWNTYLRKKVEQEHNHNKIIGQNSNNIPIKLRIDPTKSSHPMTIKSTRCSEVMMPTQTINDSVNTMNFITSRDQNSLEYIPQDGHDHYSTSFFKHFDINGLLMPYEDCHFNRYACVEKLEHFGDEAYRVNDATGETWYENWKIDDYFPLEYDGFSLF